MASTRRGIRVAEKLDAEIAAGAASCRSRCSSRAPTRTPGGGTPGAEHAAVADDGIPDESASQQGPPSSPLHMTLPFGLLPWEFADKPFKK